MDCVVSAVVSTSSSTSSSSSLTSEMIGLGIIATVAFVGVEVATTVHIVCQYDRQFVWWLEFPLLSYTTCSNIISPYCYNLLLTNVPNFWSNLDLSIFLNGRHVNLDALLYL